MLGQKSKTCVLKCNGNAALHCFPKDLVGRSVWLKQLGLKQAANNAFVCDRHFSSKMKTQGSETRITAWAIPDQNLPEVLGDSTDDDDFPEDEQYMYQKPPDVHLNGFSTNEVVSNTDDGEEQMNNGNHTPAQVENKFPLDEEPIDFDELLAKVHCITDLSKNIEKPNGILAHANESLDALGTEFNALDEGMLNTSLTLNNGDPNINNVSAPSAPIEITSKFKRRLISSVRRRRILYDPAHPLFSNIQKKKRAWEGIGKILHLNGIACRELWLNMRYDYQIHVRNLRQWLAGESSQRERPRISFENDLLFLWRHIPEKSYCGDSDDETLQFQNVAQTTAIIEQQNSIVERNNLIASRYARTADHAYANKNTDESVQFACNVIEAVKFYPEIYDCKHPNYGNAKRKSLIWEAISNELHAKASKCLWTWIVQQMRYEFEIIHQKSSYLTNRMEFLKQYIIPNEKSPFKRINSLTEEWFEPMITCTEIQALIQCFIASKRTRPFFVHICTPELDKQLQPPCWSLIGRDLKRKAEQCEVTWIAIQTMFCEVSELRRNNCPLCDEWEFESIIKKFLSSLLKTTKIIRVRDFADIPVKKRKTDGEPAIQEAKSDVSQSDVSQSDVVETISLDPPPKQLNEIKFTIPGVATDTNTPTESQLVRFNLDRPIAQLPEKSVVEIDSVLKDAHIVIFTNAHRKPNIYLFTPQLRKELIAEIMCRPLLFNEPCKLSRLTKQFWGEISIGLRYPAEVCTFFWDYIVEKLYFVDYDRTFKKSRGIKWLPPPNGIFAKFEKYANSRNWSEYVHILPEFFQEISYLPLIYVDLKVNSTWNRRQCHARDIAEAWSILGRKYAVLDNHRLLWEKFKQVYLLYLSEMEINIYNPWPTFWVPVFEKMTFLFEHRYSAKDPIYYVIKYKIQDEVVQYRRTKPLPAKLDPITNGKVIFRLLKENEYVEDFTWVNRARFVAKMKTFPMLYDVNHPLFGNKEAKLEAWQEMSLFFHCTVGECHLIFQHLMKGFLLLRARDPNHSCRVNAKYWENMTYIYMCAVPNSIDPTAVEWRTFRDASNGSTIKLAEEFQAEISVIDAKPRLVLKNLAAAVNSMPLEIQGRVIQKIKRVFAEYTRLHNEDVVVDV